MKKNTMTNNYGVVNLTERKNIKIIPLSKKKRNYTREDRLFNYIDELNKQTDNFNEYFIERQINYNAKISDAEFNLLVSDMKIKHKLLGYLLDED